MVSSVDDKRARTLMPPPPSKQTNKKPTKGSLSPPGQAREVARGADDEGAVAAVHLLVGGHAQVETGLRQRNATQCNA